MRTAHRVEEVRAAERELMARLPEGALMQRAAAGLAAHCARVLGRVAGKVAGARVVLLVGAGDNGGDALYAGARLARRGAGVRAVLMDPDRAHGGGLAALLRAGGRIADTVPGRADLVLDGLVGIGGRGGLRPAAADLAERIPAGATVVAVDLPSGVDADTGEVAGAAVTADVTVTFGTYKPGLLIDPGASRAGELHLVDIGLGPVLPGEPAVESLDDADAGALLPVPTATSDKYRRGVVGLLAGSAQYPGAAVLTVAGALRGGAGAVRYAGPAAAEVLARYPEVLIGTGRVQAWVLGPGVGADRPPLPAEDVPLLVDADGLRGLTPEAVRARTAPTLLTPHAGEAAALLGVPRASVEASRLSAVRELAARFGATVLLKGATTLIADPARIPVRVNATGVPWLATAGSGDVLSGLAGSLLAAGLTAVDAASVAAHLHGSAGRRAARGAPTTAHEIALAVPAAWRALTAG
ncbi:NAD(P)H-hydrate dehydratase [Streptomyces sp. NPDC048603]|uniref:NAD(P)H-hydrate dehydratase n=1 Tax=Streptomyces sp. NPDC048603 TaxID=3365577 RepID=UPI00371858AB